MRKSGSGGSLSMAVGVKAEKSEEKGCGPLVSDKDQGEEAAIEMYTAARKLFMSQCSRKKKKKKEKRDLSLGMAVYSATEIPSGVLWNPFSEHGTSGWKLTSPAPVDGIGKCPFGRMTFGPGEAIGESNTPSGERGSSSSSSETNTSSSDSSEEVDLFPRPPRVGEGDL